MPSATNCSCVLCNFPWKSQCQACVTASGVVGGCSPKAVLLSHVNELVRVRVWGAVVVRSLHVSVSSSLAWTDGCLTNWWIRVILPAALAAAWRQHTDSLPVSPLAARPLCAPHSVSLVLVLIKKLCCPGLLLVTCDYFRGFFFVVVVSSGVFSPFLCESAVPLDRPPRAHGN